MMFYVVFTAVFMFCSLSLVSRSLTHFCNYMVPGDAGAHRRRTFTDWIEAVEYIMNVFKQADFSRYEQKSRNTRFLFMSANTKFYF